MTPWSGSIPSAVKKRPSGERQKVNREDSRESREPLERQERQAPTAFKGRREMPRQVPVRNKKNSIHNPHAYLQYGSDSEDDELREARIALERYEEAQLPRYEFAYNAMRGIIPLDVSKSSVSKMVKQGLPFPIATRIWEKKSLWLIVMHKDDIAKVHIADLRSKYAPVGLDIVEMRAIWKVLPEWSEEEHQKCEWAENLKTKLNEMTHNEDICKLSENELRHPVYNGPPLVLFNPKAEIYSQYHRIVSYSKPETAEDLASPMNSSVDHNGNGSDDWFNSLSNSRNSLCADMCIPVMTPILYRGSSAGTVDSDVKALPDSDDLWKEIVAQEAEQLASSIINEKPSQFIRGQNNCEKSSMSKSNLFAGVSLFADDVVDSYALLRLLFILIFFGRISIIWYSK